MAIKASSKARVTNFIYSFFAGVVILGALFKITHISVGPLTGNLMLTVGLVAEAIVFFYSSIFDAPAGDYEWEKAYPELADGEPVAKKNKVKAVSTDEVNLSLSEKLDGMLKEAKLDVSLFERLRSGIDNFGSAVNEINKTTSAAAATQQYGDQLALAANHMESLNALYQVQLESGKKQNELNQRFISEMEQTSGASQNFMKEMEALTSNVNNLNKVYGGMLSAMKA